MLFRGFGSSLRLWAPLVAIFFLPVVVQSYPHSAVVHALSKRDAFNDSGLGSASWIWLPEQNLLQTAPVGPVAFLKAFQTPTNKTAASALIAITADNNFTVWVNGQPVGATEDYTINGWQSAQVLTASLNASANIFSVLAFNVGDPNANPAGLLATIRVLYADNTVDTLVTDDSWLVSGVIPSDFPLPANTAEFISAAVATQYGSGPWGTSVVVVPQLDFTASNLTGSDWLWNTDNATVDAPAGTVGFRKTVNAPAGQTPTSVTALATADNIFDFYINGELVGGPPITGNDVSGWASVQRLTANLSETSNVFTVLATNYAPQQAGGTSPAGFVGAFLVTFADGSSTVVRTDTTWLAGAVTGTPAQFIAAADSALSPALALGSYGIGPWGNLSFTADTIDVRRLTAVGGLSAAVSPVPSATTQTNLAAPTVDLTPTPVPTLTSAPSSSSSVTGAPSAAHRVRGSDIALILYTLVFLTRVFG